MLAKELDMPSKDLITFLRTQGHPIKSHMSSIEDHVANIVRDRIRKTRPIEKKPAATSTTEGAGTDKSKPASRVGGDSKAPKNPWARSGDTPARTDGFSREKDRDSKGPAGAASSKGGAAGGANTRRKRYFPTRDDLMDSGPRFGGGRRRFGAKGRGRGRDGGVAVTERPTSAEVSLPITLKDLSAALGLKANLIIKTLMQNGQVTTINQFLDKEKVLLIGLEYGIEITFKNKEEGVEERARKFEEVESSEEDLVSRAPVVTFLGHVDHGKTSLLDWIRKSKVTQGEAGGITQHLGAYRVDSGDIHVVFIDTPGHKAFTEMRARGANATDIAVLVVAVDDGVMPQTEEALNHARAAGVPIVVALNKVDKAGPNDIARTQQQLAELGVLPVAWNGDTEFVEVSAITGQGMDTLLETLSLTSELQELKADPTRPAIGVVLEAENTTGRGVVATVLVQEGTLHRGDTVFAGPAHGRVRNIFVNGTEAIDEAGPATPVKLTGLNEVPAAGDKLYAVTDAGDAKSIAEERQNIRSETERAERREVTMENLFAELEEAATQAVRLIIKADAQGSVTALAQSLESLSTDEVKVRILHKGVGAISQTDISLADASGAIVLGFHVVADERARALAEERSVEIRNYTVIYQAIDDVRDAMAARLAPEREEKIRSHSEIREVFKASKIGSIAGCIVSDGLLTRSDNVRLIRDGRVVYTGAIGSLKRFKEDVKEVKEGFECGIKVAGYDDIKQGDVIESFAIIETPRTL
jgi:translation initiation factor IF-2